MFLASRVYQRVLRWFGHVERMDEYPMAIRAMMAEISRGGCGEHRDYVRQQRDDWGGCMTMHKI